MEHSLQAGTPRRDRICRPSFLSMQRALAAIGILAVVTLIGLVLWAGLGGLLTMDAGSRSQGGQYYVGAAVIVAVVWLVSQISKFSRRV